MKPQVGSILIGTISTFLGLVGFFFQEIPIPIRVIIFLVAVIVGLICYIVYYHKFVKSELNKAKEIAKNHKALSVQFENKNKLLSIYRDNWNVMQYHISLLNQTSTTKRAIATQEYYARANIEIIEKENELND